jgi:hypothetical protein
MLRFVNMAMAHSKIQPKPESIQRKARSSMQCLAGFPRNASLESSGLLVTPAITAEDCQTLQVF